MSSLLAPLLAQALSLTLADTSQVRARATEGELRWDALTIPSATLSLASRRTGYSLTYAPVFTALSIGEPDADTVLFHTLTAAAATRFLLTTVTLQQELGYGQRNFRLEQVPRAVAPGDPGPNDPGDPMEPEDPVAPPSDPSQPPLEGAQDALVTLGASRTSLGVAHQLSPRVSLSESVEYAVSRGLDEASRAEYPDQRTLSGGSALSVAASTRDSLTTSLEGSITYTEPDVRASIVRLEEEWSRQFLEDLQLSVGAGGSYTRVDTPEGSIETLTLGFGPVGSAAARYYWSYGGTRYSIEVSGGLAPSVDRFTGVVDPRVQWGLTLAGVRDRLTVALAGSGAHSIDPNSTTALSTVGAALEAIYRLSPYLSTNAGAGVTVQALEVDSDFPPALWVAFVGLSYASAPFRL